MVLITSHLDKTMHATITHWYTAVRWISTADSPVEKEEIETLAIKRSHQRQKLTLAHRLHVRPVTPGLHWHWPLVMLHVRPDEPTGWQSQAIQMGVRYKHNHTDIQAIITYLDRPCGVKLVCSDLESSLRTRVHNVNEKNDCKPQWYALDSNSAVAKSDKAWSNVCSVSVTSDHTVDRPHKSPLIWHLASCGSCEDRQRNEVRTCKQINHRTCNKGSAPSIDTSKRVFTAALMYCTQTKGHNGHKHVPSLQ